MKYHTLQEGRKWKLVVHPQ